ncbi:beta-glucoside-specific PTS transporter subunit IIABC [Paenibacillus sp. FSL H8-0079]|uniref:beta-glucoside-specific PTS transporter subunit IIABC n=1 Tax=Paenibacillus sp. FSL H8-0079 TaxID=2921375 RepID=UPI0030EC239E
MSHQTLAKEIVQLIGGAQNVSSVVHCATRLRFTLKDREQANKQSIQDLDGVLSVVESGGQFQVVIGAHVADVYKEVTKVSTGSSSPDELQKERKSKGTLTSQIFDVISRSFSPLLGALAGAGMIKALLTVITMMGLLSTESGAYFILSAAGNAVFYFLPIFLGITLSIRLGANPYVGGAIGASLLEPNFTGLMTQAGDVSDFFGIPVVLMSYSSTVFPVFIAVCIYAVLETQLKKIIHKDLQMFFVPMLSLAIIVPLTVLVFGPFGVYVGDGIGAAIGFLSEKSGLLTGLVMGGTWTFLVIFGLHWGIVPIILANLASGGDPFAAMTAGATFAQMGVALGIFLKARDKKVKTLAGSTILPGLLAGITEPFVYGVMLRFRRTILYIVAAGAVGGAINGYLGVQMQVFAFHTLFAIPAFSPMVLYIFGISISFFGAAIITYLFGFEEKKTKVDIENSIVEVVQPLVKTQKVVSPLTGIVKSLADVEDEAFATEAMGKGIAIEPTVGQAVSPVTGVVTTVFPTGHAIGITSDEGAEILIHIGTNTVKLKGKYFTQIAKEGDRVSEGDLLVEFDIEKIKEAGYPVTTPVIITNTDRYIEVIGTDKEVIQAKESLLTLIV